MSTEDEYKSEDRREEPLKDVFLLFLFAIMYYFCSTTTENVYYNYIYSIAICSDLEFTVSMIYLNSSLHATNHDLGYIRFLIVA